MANNIEQKIEAILFAVGDPISVKKLAGIIDQETKEVEEGLMSLKKKYADASSGIYIIEHESGIQLVTKPEVSFVIERLVKTEVHENLTPATLETLSLVAYLSPITKSSLEYIRGVNSSYTLRNLLIRGLIERVPHPKRPNTYLYRETADLIRHLGITKKEELTDFAKYQELKENLENE